MYDITRRVWGILHVGGEEIVYDHGEGPTAASEIHPTLLQQLVADGVAVPINRKRAKR